MQETSLCPNNKFVEDKTFELLSSQVLNKNPDAITGSSLLRYVDRRSIAKLISHYEIYKLVDKLPGHILEFGVFKGESLLRFAMFSEIFNPYDRSFDVIGFDNFSGFPKFHPKDGIQSQTENKVEGGWSSADYRDELYKLIEIFDNNRFVPQKPRIKIVEGDICQTAPQFLINNPGIKSKLIHLDADLYEPTLISLETFWDSLVIGGVLVLDEYGFDLYPGEASAVDEFFKKRNITPEIKKFSFSDNPGAYIIKTQY